VAGPIPDDDKSDRPTPDDDPWGDLSPRTKPRRPPLAGPTPQEREAALAALQQRADVQAALADRHAKQVTPPSLDPFPVLAFRSTKRTADRLDALRPYLATSGKAPLVGEMTRADLLRLAVEEGLICLERRARRAGGDR
jgi:hypothetical protein